MTDDVPVDQHQSMAPGSVPDGMQNFSMDNYPQYMQSNQVPVEILNLLLRNQPLRSSTMPNEFTARGSWSQQEDEQLISAVQQFGTKKWTDVAKFVPTRTSKQCRERWHHRLDPTIKHEPFEAWEDRIILEKQREIGNRWAVIASSLPGRSASAIKNRWYSGLKSQHPTHAQMDLSTLGQLQIGGDPVPPPLDAVVDTTASEMNQPPNDL